MAHADFFRINVSVIDMHRLADSILYISNAFHHTNVPIHERVYVSTPPYYIDWFDKYYPNFPLNQDYGQFFLQCMNGIQGKKTSVPH